MREIISMLIVFVLICSSACSSGELSGEYEGTVKLSRIYYNSDDPDLIKSETGRISFPSARTLRFGSGTPLPDCNLEVNMFSDTEFTLNYGVQFKGETNDGRGCEAVVADSRARVEINHATMKGDVNGEIVIKVNFEPRDSDGASNYQVEFNGKKKGWF